MTLMAKHISVSIERRAAEVYEFASNPENLPRWAGGLSGSIKNVDDEWIAEAPMGTVKVNFAEKNKFGILDHDVTLSSGTKFYNPMRVFPNNDGSEIVFTLYRLAGMSDQKFADDAGSVERDLNKLKTFSRNKLHPGLNPTKDEQSTPAAVSECRSGLVVTELGDHFARPTVLAVCVRIPDRFLTLSLDSCTVGLI